MENNEILVPEQGAENTEQTVEETPKKLYTEDELNAKLNEGFGKKLARKEAKIRKEYKPLEDFVEAMKVGTGKQTIEELTEFVQDFYKSKGLEMPEKKQFSARDVEILARSDADEIIASGAEEVADELKRLADLGVDNMSDREKAMFSHLAQYEKNAQRVAELSKLGIPKEVYESEEFNTFAAMFDSGVPMEKVYETYEKTKPKEEIKPMGPVTSTAQEGSLKDYYSPEEASKFSREFLDKNPDVFRKIIESMPQWK